MVGWFNGYLEKKEQRRFTGSAKQGNQGLQVGEEREQYWIKKGNLKVYRL